MEFNLKLTTLLILTYINFKYLNTLFILIFIKKSRVIYVIITTFHSNANLNMNTIKGQFIMFYYKKRDIYSKIVIMLKYASIVKIVIFWVQLVYHQKFKYFKHVPETIPRVHCKLTIKIFFLFLFGFFVFVYVEP